MSVDGRAETAQAAEAAEAIATPKTEAALAQRISHGDVAAWETFFDQYAPWAYRFAYHHLGGNQADAGSGNCHCPQKWAGPAQDLGQANYCRQRGGQRGSCRRA